MSRPLRVVIADDEPLARQRVRRLLRREADVPVVGECVDGGETVATVVRESPDLLFLDVQMPELDGFAVLRALPAERLPVTVFVTAFDRYAVQAFEARALDYLLKPFTEARFRAAFERARGHLGGTGGVGRSDLLGLLEQLRQEVRAVGQGGPAAADRLLVKEEGRVLVVPLAQVDYLEASRNHVRVHAGTVVHVLRETLGSLEARLDPRQFARIHRSVLVNLDRVAEIQPWFSGDAVLRLHDGTSLRLSRSYRAALEERLASGSRQRLR